MVTLHRVHTLFPVIAILLHATPTTLAAGTTSAEDCANDSMATSGAMFLSETTAGGYAGSYEARVLKECESQLVDADSCTVDVSSWYGPDFPGRCNQFSGKVIQYEREYTCTGIGVPDHKIRVNNLMNCVANTCSIEHVQELMSDPVAYSDYYDNVSCTGREINIREGTGSTMM